MKKRRRATKAKAVQQNIEKRTTKHEENELKLQLWK